MPKFPERAVYGTTNKLGALRGSKETAPGRKYEAHKGRHPGGRLQALMGKT